MIIPFVVVLKFKASYNVNIGYIVYGTLIPSFIESYNEYIKLDYIFLKYALKQYIYIEFYGNISYYLYSSIKIYLYYE